MMHLSRYSAEREIGFLVILWNMLIEVRDSSRKQIRIRKPVLLSLQSDPGEKKSSFTPDMVISFYAELWGGLILTMSYNVCS